jgi:hypothetical protein
MDNCRAKLVVELLDLGRLDDVLGALQTPYNGTGMLLTPDCNWYLLLYIYVLHTQRL